MYVLPQGELSSNWTVNTGSLYNCTVYSRGQGAHAQCVHCTLYSWRHVLVSAPVRWRQFWAAEESEVSPTNIQHFLRWGNVSYARNDACDTRWHCRAGAGLGQGGVTSWAKLLYYVKYHIYYFSMTMHAIIHNLQCSQHPYFKMAKFRKYKFEENNT